MLRIDEMFAFIAEDEEGEGLMGATLPIQGQMMFTPLVGADMERIKSLLPVAQQISQATGKSFKVCRFHQVEDITQQVLEGGRSGPVPGA